MNNKLEMVRQSFTNLFRTDVEQKRTIKELRQKIEEKDRELLDLKKDSKLKIKAKKECDEAFNLIKEMTCPLLVLHYPQPKLFVQAKLLPMECAQSVKDLTEVALIAGINFVLAPVDNNTTINNQQINPIHPVKRTAVKKKNYIIVPKQINTQRIKSHKIIKRIKKTSKI